MSSLFRPLSTLRSQSTIHAPARILNATGRPRIPTPTGSWPYTLKACVGQKNRIEKKLAPEMKVITRVRARMRGACLRRAGNIGYGARASQKPKPIMRSAPSISGTSTCADLHGYCCGHGQLKPRLLFNVGPTT